jgi:cell wall assembly regulator SMI1
MNDTLMQRLTHFFAKEEHDTLRGRPALDEEIKAAEEKLNVKFHDDYKNFIKRFGGAHAGMNVHAFSNGSSLGKETVVGLTLGARESYAGDERAVELNKSYVISLTGAGDPIIINPVGEVVALYHDSDEREVLAASLEELLQDIFVEW